MRDRSLRLHNPRPRKGNRVSSARVFPHVSRTTRALPMECAGSRRHGPRPFRLWLCRQSLRSTCEIGSRHRYRSNGSLTITTVTARLFWSESCLTRMAPIRMAFTGGAGCQKGHWDRRCIMTNIIWSEASMASHDGDKSSDLGGRSGPAHSSESVCAESY